MKRGIFALAMVAVFWVGAAFASFACPRLNQKVAGARISYMYCGGHPGPTLVFESGMGEDASTWDRVLAELPPGTNTFAYDRAGLGRSTATERGRDAGEIARELHELLEKAGAKPPYILVGHSLGGLIVTVFAHAYSQEISGIVLVDMAFNEAQLRQRLPAATWQQREQAIARYTPPMSPTQTREKAALQRSTDQAHAARALPNVPAVVLTATLVNEDFPGAREEHQVKLENHAEWMARLKRVRQEFVPESRHYVQHDAPQKVVQAIAWVLEQAAASAAKSRV